MLSIWPLVTLGAVAVVMWFVGSELQTSARGQVTRSFVCPNSGEEVTTQLQSDFFEPQRYRDVLACSRYAGLGRRPAIAPACASTRKTSRPRTRSGCRCRSPREPGGPRLQIVREKRWVGRAAPAAGR
jgi:hypothetical protein